MEARSLLLTSLVFALWTSTTTGQDFCVSKNDGPYCEHCWQPIECTAGVSTEYQSCGQGMACTVAFGASYCTSHTETDCACSGASNQCDVYNTGYIEHCNSSGPFLVDACPSSAPICYHGECGAYPACNPNDWNLTPDCNGAYFCDSDGEIIAGIDCADDEYVNSEFECAPAPPPACDGSCTGRCPNPVDCTKFFICNGTTVIASGDCLDGSFFDIDTNDCVKADFTCSFLDGCDIGVGGTPVPEITTTSGEITTQSDEITTTSDGITTTSDEIITTCNSSTVGSKYPYGPCSKQFYMCAELAFGQYEYILTSCLGDDCFDTDPTNPYCTLPENIDTCLV